MAKTCWVQTMDIDNSGVGHASVNVQKDLTVQQSFLGKVTNVGNGKTCGKKAKRYRQEPAETYPFFKDEAPHFTAEPLFTWYMHKLLKPV